MLLAIVAGTAHPKLADKGAGFTISLLVGASFIGLSEEDMFRGIGVLTFRQAGFECLRSAHASSHRAVATGGRDGLDRGSSASG